MTKWIKKIFMNLNENRNKKELKRCYGRLLSYDRVSGEPCEYLNNCKYKKESKLIKGHCLESCCCLKYWLRYLPDTTNQGLKTGGSYPKHDEIHGRDYVKLREQEDRKNAIYRPQLDEIKDKKDTPVKINEDDLCPSLLTDPLTAINRILNHLF